MWDPLVKEDAYALVTGESEIGRSYFLTRWFGREDPETSAASKGSGPDVLGDSRTGIRVSTPSRLQIDLPMEGSVRFQAAVRLESGTGPPGAKVLAMVLLQEDNQWQNLTTVELSAAPEPGKRPWRELECSFQSKREAKLELVCRWADNLQANRPGPKVTWANPKLLRNPPPERDSKSDLPDVLLVTVDTFRADAMDHAPGLQKLCKQGRYWPGAISPSNWTLPAYASLFTGSPPEIHGAGRGSFQGQERDYRALKDSALTLAEIFQRKGYATCMIHANPFLEPWTGLAKGFERYVRCRDETAIHLSIADAWWQRERSRPRFLVLHLMAPHLPYAPPQVDGLELELGPDPMAEIPWREFLAGEHNAAARQAFFTLDEELRERIRRRYFAEVRTLDHQLSPWLQAKMAQNSSLIVGFHSDHGEELWDQGSFEHGHSFADAVVQVPVALIWPTHLSPAESQQPVPAHGLAGEILSVLDWQDPTRSWIDLSNFQGELRSSQPLYANDHGGRIWQSHGSQPIPFGQAGTTAGGLSASLEPALQQALAELGYATSPNLDEGSGN